MSKLITLKTAFCHCLVLSALVFAMIPVYQAIYRSPLPRVFATRVAPEEVGFTGDSYGALIHGPFYIITDGVAYLQNTASLAATYFPMYILALISILGFIKFRPKRCSVFALPISFALSPIMNFFMIFPAMFVMLGSAMGLTSFWRDTVLLFSLPLCVVTLCIAVLFNKKRRTE